MPSEYKRCSSCATEKPLGAFGSNRSRADGLAYDCRECRSRKSRTPKERARARSVQVKRYAEVQALFAAMKSSPCLDCGGSFPPCVMDFDHRDPSKKQIDIAHYSGGGISPKLLAELEQCDIICSNCHRIRTAAQRTAKAFRIGRRRLT